MSAFVFGVVVVLVPEKGSDGVQTVDHDHQPFQPPLESPRTKSQNGIGRRREQRGEAETRIAGQDYITQEHRPSTKSIIGF